MTPAPDARNVACPACGDPLRDPEPVFHLPSVPVQSVRLVSAADQARSFPSAELDLIRCRHCGFLFNRAFDPLTQHWDSRYEETQICSDHFGRFADDLAQQLIDRYALRGRRILEVGCGKGHFLAALCRDGLNQGLGVDPAFDPDRHPDPGGTARFDCAPLGASHRGFRPDLVVCRHTLEHIADPVGFLESIRRTGAPDLFVEVPDQGRIDREGAFWDLYYEHCSNFDEDSLVTTLGRAGYSTLETRVVFHGQYLLAFARSGEAAAAPPSSRQRRYSAMQAAWGETLAKWQRTGRQALLWGGGSKAVGFLSALPQHAGVIRGAIDINPRKQGRFLPGSGLPVLAPEALREARPDAIVVMNPAYRTEIADRIRALGLRVPLLPVTEPG